jgi:hypothetical protein
VTFPSWLGDFESGSFEGNFFLKLHPDGYDSLGEVLFCWQNDRFLELLS